MRYFVTFEGGTEAAAVDVERLEDGRFAVTHRGARHVVDAHAAGPGSLSLIVDGQAYAADVERTGQETRVTLDDGIHRLTLINERAHRALAAAGGPAAQGRQVVRSPMPGKVVKVLVAQGDAVVEGQGLVVVEAMKMENELKSPKAGTVAELWAREGATVEGNAPLASID